MRIAPSTDCSASRLCGGRRSITRTPKGGRGRHCPGRTPGSFQRSRAPRCAAFHGIRPAVGSLWRTSWISTWRSVQFADDPDELALDPDVVIELRRVLRIRRLEADLVLLLEEPLQGDRVLFDL